MCGIVATTGPCDVYGLLPKGVKRLKYRRCDSASIALQDGEGCVHRWRVPGKTPRLEALPDTNLSGLFGVAHTR